MIDMPSVLAAYRQLTLPTPTLPLVTRGLMTTVVTAGAAVDVLTVELDRTVPVEDVEREDVDVTSRLNCPGCHVEAAQSLEATVMLTNEEKRTQKPRP